jgi:hypothetical protein
VFPTATEAKTHPRRVVKLRLFSSCFEYLDFFVGNEIACASESGLPSVKTCSVRGITYPNVSYLSQKVMSEVSVSQRRRSPSARSALAAYVYSVVFRIHFQSSQKARKTFWQKRSFFEEDFDAEGVPPF